MKEKFFRQEFQEKKGGERHQGNIGATLKRRRPSPAPRELIKKN